MSLDDKVIVALGQRDLAILRLQQQLEDAQAEVAILKALPPKAP